MNEASPDASVPHDEELEESLVLPDMDDRHVLVTAITGEAHVIVTQNVRDFPEDALRKYGIAAQTPDEFLLTLLQADADRVCLALFVHKTSMKKPIFSADEYFAAMRGNGLAASADHVQLLGCIT